MIQSILEITVSLNIALCVEAGFCQIQSQLQIFPYNCLFTFFGNNYNIGELKSATSKERMTTIIICMGATPIK